MFKEISLILFILSAIVNADTVDIALVNEEEIEKAQDIEEALLNTAFNSVFKSNPEVINVLFSSKFFNFSERGEFS